MTRPGAGAIVGLVILALCGGCAAPAPQSREPGPVGREVFDRTLENEAGVAASADDLYARASEAKGAFVSRMNRLAERIEPGADWLAVFDRLRLDGPTEVDELLGRYRTELERAAAFVRGRDLVKLPEQALPVVEVQNLVLRSVFPLALYLDGKLAVTTSATADPDPAYLANHCSICIPPLAVHEGYPGHHVAFSLMDAAAGQPAESPSGPAGPEPVEGRRPHNRFLVEGWGLYAELLMLEQGYYFDDPARELGAWRMLLLRAVRAEVDVQLHLREIGEEEAVQAYVSELGMTPGAARTEVRRHLAEPTTKASYFAGLLQILELRRRAGAASAVAGELRAFHDRLLREAGLLPEASVAELGLAAFAIELQTLGRQTVDWDSFATKPTAAP